VDKYEGGLMSLLKKAEAIVMAFHCDFPNLIVPAEFEQKIDELKEACEQEQEKVRLDIDLISERTYFQILQELKKQFGDAGYYIDWTITAKKDK
jgi:hypothetical protein